MALEGDLPEDSGAIPVPATRSNRRSSCRRKISLHELAHWQRRQVQVIEPSPHHQVVVVAQLATLKPMVELDDCRTTSFSPTDYMIM